MRRLLWKELTEIKWLALSMIAAPTLYVVVDRPGLHRGDANSSWSLLWIAFGGALGAIAYSRELTWETPGFIYSRPIRWWQLWMLKFCVGTTVCLASAIVPVAVYRLVCREVYLPFADLASLSRGAAYWFGCAFISFSCVFACSAVASDLGSIAVVGFVSWLFVTILGEIQRRSLGMIPLVWSGAPIALVTASLLVAPHLTQPLTSRVKRFATGLLISSTLLFVLPLLLLSRQTATLFQELSPDHRFVIRAERLQGRNPGQISLILGDRTLQSDRVIEKGGRAILLGWSPDSRQCLYLYQKATNHEVIIKSLDLETGESSAVAETPFRWHSVVYFLDPPPHGIWAPNGSCLLFRAPEEPGGKGDPSVSTFLFDSRGQTLHKLPRGFPPGENRIWWLSEEEVAAENLQEARIHVINVRNGKERFVNIGRWS